MELQLVSKEVAILAKELGFDFGLSLAHFSWNHKDVCVDDLDWKFKDIDEICNLSEVRVPTQELLAKWLRDVHKLYIEITRDMSNWVVDVCNLTDVEVTFVGDDILILINKTFKTYEDALEGGLLAVLNGIKKNLKVD